MGPKWVYYVMKLYQLGNIIYVAFLVGNSITDLIIPSPRFEREVVFLVVTSFKSSVLVEQGSLHAKLVDAIKPHVPVLRTSPYGKKVLSSNSLKK